MKTTNTAFSIALQHNTLTADQERAYGHLMQIALKEVLKSYRQHITLIRNLCTWLVDNPEDALSSPSTIELETILDAIQWGREMTDKNHRNQLYQRAQDHFVSLPITFDGANLLHNSLASALETRMDVRLQRILRTTYLRASKALAKWEAHAQVLISCNLRLVLKQVGERTAPGMTKEDLFQDGVTGLRRAVEKWDVNRGLRFSTYAVPWINQSISRAIKNKANLIRIPINLQGLEMDEELLRIQPFSLNETKFEDGEIGDYFPDLSVPAPDELPQEVCQMESLRTMLDALNENDRNIISLRYGLYGEAFTRAQTADIVGLKESQVRYIEERSLARLHTMAADTVLVS